MSAPTKQEQKERRREEKHSRHEALIVALVERRPVIRMGTARRMEQQT